MVLFRLLLVSLVISAACGGGGDGSDPETGADGAPALRDSPPVPLDAAPPVSYPVDLYEQGVSGTVMLRLYVDTAGVVLADSVRIEESSGHPGFDSAAVAAAPRLRYAPALRAGKPVAAPFRQPIHFRHPSGGPTP